MLFCRQKNWKSHCVKSVRIRSYSGPYFSRICVFPNAGKYGPEKLTNTFHAMSC